MAGHQLHQLSPFRKIGELVALFYPFHVRWDFPVFFISIFIFLSSGEKRPNLTTTTLWRMTNERRCNSHSRKSKLKTMLLYCVSRVVRKLWPIQSLVSPFYSTGPDETFCRYRLCCCWLFAHLLHLVGCLVASISAHSTCYCSLLRNAFRMFGQ